MMSSRFPSGILHSNNGCGGEKRGAHATPVIGVARDSVGLRHETTP